MDRDITLRLAPSPAVGIATCSPTNQLALCTGAKVHILVPNPTPSSKTPYAITELDLDDSAAKPDEVIYLWNPALTGVYKRGDGGRLAAWNRTGGRGGGRRMVSTRPLDDESVCSCGLEFTSSGVPLGNVASRSHENMD